MSSCEHICVCSQGEQNFFFFVKFNYNNAEPALLIACFSFRMPKAHSIFDAVFLKIAAYYFIKWIYRFIVEPLSYYYALVHFQYFSVISSPEMKVLAHKAFPLFRIISLGFSEVELLGQRV